jgi:cyclase
MIKKISDFLYVETGVRGCNHGFVVTDDGVVMIDTPFMYSNSVSWGNEIARHGSVSYIINTEPHVDHFSGNAFFEGIIIAHEGTRQMIIGTPPGEYLQVLASEEPDSMNLVGDYSFRLPDITLAERMYLYTGNRVFQLTAFPGHTPYQVAVYLPEEKALFTSDNVVSNTIPFITPQAHVFKWLDSLRQMQNMDADFVIPGHGSIQDKSCLQVMINELQIWVDTVWSVMEQGMSLEETQKKVNLLDRYREAPLPKEVVARTHEMNVITVYRALRKRYRAREK